MVRSQSLLRQWRLALAIFLVTIAAVCVAALAQKPTYTASAQAFVSIRSASTTTDLSQGSTFTQQIVSSYAEVATSPLVLDRVKRQLDFADSAAISAGTVTAEASPSTVVITVAAKAAGPTVAANIANAVLVQLDDVVQDLNPSSSTGASDVKITITSPARPKGASKSPNVAVALGLAVVLGLFLALLVAYVRARFDRRIRTVEDIERISSSPVIGRIPFDGRAGTSDVIALGATHALRAEHYKALRTNLRFVQPSTGRSAVFVVTSTVPKEGKSTTTLNLAIALAASGVRVAVVDADMRRPRVAAYLGLEGGLGLADVIVGDVKLSDAIQVWGGDQALHILPAGTQPPNPSELLERAELQDTLEALRVDHDVVLLDAPPVLPVTDAAAIAAATDGVLLIVGAGRVRSTQVCSAFEDLERAGGMVRGIVVNLLPMSSMERAGYAIYYEE